MALRQGEGPGRERRKGDLFACREIYITNSYLDRLSDRRAINTGQQAQDQQARHPRVATVTRFVTG